MNDTREAVNRMYRDRLLALAPGERLAMACRMFSTARALVEAGIRMQRPDIRDAVSLRREVFLRLYGRDLPEARTAAILRNPALKPST